MHVGNGNVPYRSDAVYAKEALAEYGNAFAEAATAVKQKNRSKNRKNRAKKDTEQKNPCLFLAVWRKQKRKSDRKFGGYILQNVEKKDRN